MSISEMVAAVFDEAAHQQPDLLRAWIRISVCLGGALPASTVMSSVQKMGYSILFFAAWRTSARSYSRPQGLPEIPYQRMLSETWVGSVYEALRCIVERGSAIANDDVRSLSEDFRLLRIPLEKHEIASDRGALLTLQKIPPKGDETEVYVYDKADAKHAHIMPMRLSPRGSFDWYVTDLKTGQARWIERRSLSDRMIALFDRGPTTS